jgi:hypothetical protein
MKSFSEKEHERNEELIAMESEEILPPWRT